MITVFGTYQNGYVKLDEDFLTNNPLKVIVTFLEDVQYNQENSFSLNDF